MSEKQQSDTPRTDATQIWWFGDNRPGMSAECVNINFARELERENIRLKAIFPDILKAIANGSACAPDCSIEFLTWIPKEVASVVFNLREQLAEAKRLLLDHQWGRYNNECPECINDYPFHTADCALAKAIQ